MAVEIRVPSPGESVQEVVIAAWLKADGDWVEQDEEILELESEKATLMVSAPASGRLSIAVAAGTALPVGAVAGAVDASGAPVAPAPASLPAEVHVQEGHAGPSTASPVAGHPSPAARKLLAEAGLNSREVPGTGPGGRITKADAQLAVAQHAGTAATLSQVAEDISPVALSPLEGRRESRTPLSPLRQKLAQRLVAVKNQTAMLTTFNEADMSQVKELRAAWRERFKEEHGVDLGFMGFFAAATARALQDFPQVNSRLDGNDLVEPAHVDLGIAVSAPKGLVVPVIRNAHALGLEELEREIARLAGRARENRITIEEMTGGTFTISNGGVFGSLLSTPILNPPQCGILGLHAIQDRPVAVAGRVEIRPMMYLALSYDHRIIDGRESVGFLKRVKELVENPVRLLLKV
jgi:2-oxoglutarate dehydrogenase E2 component (dihydrolipoamide succinyltransferase)